MVVNVLFFCISVLSKSRPRIWIHNTEALVQWRLQAYVFATDKILFLQFIPCRKAGSVTVRLLLLCRGMLFMWKSVACTLSYHAAKTLCGALFAELWAMPSSAEHPCPGLPTFTSLYVFLEPVPWGNNVLLSNLENTGTQWARVWQVSCAVTALLLQHFWPCGVNSGSSDSSENSIFMLIYVSSLFYRTSPLLIFSSYHLLWPISVIAFLEYCLVSLNR